MPFLAGWLTLVTSNYSEYRVVAHTQTHTHTDTLSNLVP